MMIEIGINSTILSHIRAGRKTVEGRLAKDKFLTIRPGDSISIREDKYEGSKIIRSINDAAEIKVTGIQKFESFENMLKSIGYGSVIPDADSLEKACDEYARYYSDDDQKQYGVLAISFVLNR